MPELPEVESLRRGLLPFLQNQTILKVEVKLSKLVSGKGTKRLADEVKKEEFEKELTGVKILDIKRRAKNLIFELENQKILLVHLKMTGQMVFKPNKKKMLVTGGHPIQISEKILPNKHTYIIFKLKNGNLYYNDIRQFGYVLYFKNLEEMQKEHSFEMLGFEPLSDFSFEDFYKKMKTKTGSLKSVFLDQKVIVGLGNIYADEVCFKAGVRPFRKANQINKNEYQKIYQAIKEIIPNAIELGGSSVSNYLLADGSKGNYAREHKVYNKAKKPCLICGNILEKTIISSRTTVYCPSCQK
jgi:formamidopyrimidine-DNA glycosylase